MHDNAEATGRLNMIKMITVDRRITQSIYNFILLQITHLSHHHRQQRIAGYFKWFSGHPCLRLFRNGSNTVRVASIDYPYVCIGPQFFITCLTKALLLRKGDSLT